MWDTTFNKEGLSRPPTLYMFPECQADKSIIAETLCEVFIQNKPPRNKGDCENILLAIDKKISQKIRISGSEPFFVWRVMICK